MRPALAPVFVAAALLGPGCGEPSNREIAVILSLGPSCDGTTPGEIGSSIELTCGGVIHVWIQDDAGERLAADCAAVPGGTMVRDLPEILTELVEIDSLAAEPVALAMGVWPPSSGATCAAEASGLEGAVIAGITAPVDLDDPDAEFHLQLLCNPGASDPGGEAPGTDCEEQCLNEFKGCSEEPDGDSGCELAYQQCLELCGDDPANEPAQPYC